MDPAAEYAVTTVAEAIVRRVPAQLHVVVFDRKSIHCELDLVGAVEARSTPINMDPKPAYFATMVEEAQVRARGSQLDPVFDEVLFSLFDNHEVRGSCALEGLDVIEPRRWTEAVHDIVVQRGTRLQLKGSKLIAMNPWVPDASTSFVQLCASDPDAGSTHGIELVLRSEARGGDKVRCSLPPLGTGGLDPDTAYIATIEADTTVRRRGEQLQRLVDVSLCHTGEPATTLRIQSFAESCNC